MAIFIDFSQAVLSACYAFEPELSVNNPDKEGAKSIVRHVILSQIKFWYNKFKYEFGNNLIISCDGKHYWRKEIFKNYKFGRKKARQKSNLDWKIIFEIMDSTIDDLRENFPYSIVRVDGAESDDVIAVLTKYFQTHEMNESGIFAEPQKIVIISSDRDFIQLQKYNNVAQMSPMKKEFVHTDDAIQYLTEKIWTGDRGDGIPSVLAGDDAFLTEGFRSPPLTKKRKEFLSVNTPETCIDPEIKKNWIRNRQLIDFEYIPENIETAIIEEYKKPIKGNKAKIFNYLVKYQCFQLLKEIDSF